MRSAEVIGLFQPDRQGISPINTLKGRRQAPRMQSAAREDVPGGQLARITSVKEGSPEAHERIGDRGRAWRP